MAPPDRIDERMALHSSLLGCGAAVPRALGIVYQYIPVSDKMSHVRYGFIRVDFSMSATCLVMGSADCPVEGIGLNVIHADGRLASGTDHGRTGRWS